MTGRRARLEWSHEALRDLRRLHRFLGPKSPRAADKAIAAIREAINLLCNFPEAGRIVDGSPTDHRELLVPFGDSGYVVAYGVRGDVVEIIVATSAKPATDASALKPS